MSRHCRAVSITGFLPVGIRGIARNCQNRVATWKGQPLDRNLPIDNGVIVFDRIRMFIIPIPESMFKQAVSKVILRNFVV